MVVQVRFVKLERCLKYRPFSPFTIGSQSNINPLPINLQSLSGNQINSCIRIRWSIISPEINNKIILEKSYDGINWTTLGKYNIEENINYIQNDSVIDFNCKDGIQYYRLAQYDFYQEKMILGICKSKYESYDNQVTMCPNPARETINIEMESKENCKDCDKTISILNIQGLSIFSITTSENNITSNLLCNNSGIYCIRIDCNSKVLNMPILIEN